MPLPKKEAPVKATRVGPKVLVLYSLPKVGKTEALTQLAAIQDCLILDTEGGTETYDTTKVPVKSMGQFESVMAEIVAEGKANKAAGKTGMDIFPYKFLALDTLDKFEEYAEASATEKYRSGPKNSKGKFEEEGYTSITELPNGYGYQYLRTEVMDSIARLGQLAPYVILIVHVKDKLFMTKEGIEVKVNDISLTGKLAPMVCAEADGVGYMYRTSKGELRVTFKTYEGAIMGARQKYLAGDDMVFSWATIYPEVFPESQPAEKEAVQTTATV